jgi:ferredoxin
MEQPPAKILIVFPKSGQSCEVDYDDTLVDATFRYDLPIRYRCERAVCTTCMTEVLEGLENLSSPNERETKTLKTVGAAANYRLACQCSVYGDVKLDYIPITDPRRKPVSSNDNPL